MLSSGAVATRPAPGASIPASVTSAIEALARAQSLELAPIRVNVVRPGPVRTALWDATIPDPGELYKTLSGQLPLGRVGEADEVAAAHIHLMESGFSTGSVITIDGEQSLA